MNLTADFTKENGLIRALNGMNFGPNISNQKGKNMNEDYTMLRIPYARLHDVPLSNPGMRLVDIQHIFGNFHADENDPRNYYFKATDDYIRNARSCGTDIIYRLGTSIEHSLDNYFAYPPEDMDKWVRICINIVRHYNEGWANGFSWNIKYWEVWNEPNAKPHMWSGSDEQYMLLYAKFARALKAHDSSLKVGGPSLSCPVQPARWESPRKYARDFLAYCKKENLPLDFFSWHCYPVNLSYIIEEPYRIKKELDEAGFPDTELHLNEWHFTKSWANTPEMKDGMHGINGIDSACAVANILSAWQDSPLTMGNYYTAGSSGGWGLYDRYRQRYKTFYSHLAFAKMLEYPSRVTAESAKEEISILAGRNEKNQGAILVSCFESTEKSLTIELKNAMMENIKVQVLDETRDLAECAYTVKKNKITLKKENASTLFLITGDLF